MTIRIAIVAVLATVGFAATARADAPARLTVDAEPPGTVVELAPPAKKASCKTPCALDAPSGRVQLLLSGPTVEESTVDLDLPANGASVRLRAPQRRAYNIGALLAAMGVPIALSGAGVMIAPAAGPPNASGPTPYYAGGGVTIGIGLALTTAGAILLARERPRVLETRVSR